MIIVSSTTNSADQVTDGVIFENQKYYLIIENPNSEELIRHLTQDKSFSRHLDWIPGNGIATLRIRNHIGKFRILDTEFDVRSSKFLSELTGVEQLNFIISDLDRMSKQATFTYDSSIYLDTKTDWQELQADLIHRFNILYNACFKVAKNKRVGSLFKIIKSNPAREFQSVANKVRPWELKLIREKELLSLIKSGQLNQGPGSLTSNLISVSSQKYALDTPENRFVLFFFRYCEQICLRLLSINEDDKHKGFEWYKVREILKFLQIHLSDKFFDSIGKLPTFSSASNILLQRSGYKELFRLFNQSLFALKTVFEWENELHTSDLNDVATIYEVWCFYKVATQILGEDIFVNEKETYLENGKLRYSVVFSNIDYEISFNKTYSRNHNTSYSSQLRPDISILCRSSNDLHHMDAKYKIRKQQEEVGETQSGYTTETSLSTFKSEDINKMHAYLDAIIYSKSSLVLYPGEDFTFYQKHAPQANNAITDVSIPFTLNGVGALPLMPGDENKDFFDFMKTFF